MQSDEHASHGQSLSIDQNIIKMTSLYVHSADSEQKYVKKDTISHLRNI